MPADKLNWEIVEFAIKGSLVRPSDEAIFLRKKIDLEHRAFDHFLHIIAEFSNHSELTIGHFLGN